MANWEIAKNDKCVKCKGPLEITCSAGGDAELYVDAERCTACKWQATYSDKIELTPGYTEIFA